MHGFARTSPMLLTVLLLAQPLVFFVGTATSRDSWFPTTTGGRLAFDMATVLANVTQIAWIWSVYEIATISANCVRDPLIRLLFAGLLLMQVALLIWSLVAPTEVYLFLFGYQGENLLAASSFVGLLLLLICAWNTAGSLIAADRPGPRRYSRFGTFWLMMALPVGVWFLHRRVIALWRA